MIERRYRGGWTIAGCPTLASVALPKDDEQRYRSKSRQAFVAAIPKLSELRPIVEIDLLPPEWFEDSDVELLFRHIDPSKLRFFRVLSPHISDQIVPLLEKATSLIELDLGETQVSNEVGKALSGMGSLRSLSLKSTPITHDLAIHLMNHQSLARLSLEGTEFGDDGIPAISTIHSLKTLNLSSTTLTNQSAMSLAEYKGLEADCVLLFLEGSSPFFDSELYVGISRARRMLAVVLDRPAIAKLPRGFRPRWKKIVPDS